MVKRLASTVDLELLRAQARADVELRNGPKATRITVHMSTCGIAAGARDVMGWLMEDLGSDGARAVTLGQAGCAGLCAKEPMLTLADAEGRTFRYGPLDRERVKSIVEGHVRGGRPVERLLITG